MSPEKQAPDEHATMASARRAAERAKAAEAEQLAEDVATEPGPTGEQA